MKWPTIGMTLRMRFAMQPTPEVQEEEEPEALAIGFTSQVKEGTNADAGAGQ